MTIFNQTDCIISALWNYIVLNLLKTYPISVFKSWKYYKNAVCFGKIFVIIKNVKSFCLRQAGKQVRQKIRQIKVWKKIKVVWCCKWSKKGLRQIWRADRRERERERERILHKTISWHTLFQLSVCAINIGFLNIGQYRPLFVYFRSFQITIQI